MNVDCFFTHQSCNEEDFCGKTVVVIDVLRATSSIITAFMAGVDAVIPVKEIADALALRQSMPHALLAGEREGRKLAGFDFGNSPFEFTREAIAGKIIITCTTNGTAAMQKAAAGQIWLGALLNARAVAQKALDNEVDSLAILCAGTEGAPSLDDTMAAGAILHHLDRSITLDDHYLNDAAVMTLRLYQSYAGMDMHQVLKLSRHGKKLIRCGCAHDVRYCAQQDISAIVPWQDRETRYLYD